MAGKPFEQQIRLPLKAGTDIVDGKQKSSHKTVTGCEMAYLCSSKTASPAATAARPGGKISFCN